MNKIHLYQMRHVFLDDDHIGKYDVPTRSIRLRAEFAEHKDRVKAHFMSAHGLVATVVAGDEEFGRVALSNFPDSLIAVMDPDLGDKTPALIAYAREHFSERELKQRYPDLKKPAASKPKPETV